MNRKFHNHIWFDTQAVEAARFYVSVFENAEIEFHNVIHDTPSGDCDIIALRIEDAMFQFINAGPYFKPNPSISFTVSCESEEETDRLWSKLSEEGKVMMELAEYPFARKYGWCEDKFGVSWQLSFSDRKSPQKIITNFLFTNEVAGKAEEAINFWTSVFPASNIDFVSHYGEEAHGPDKPEYVNWGAFQLVNQSFSAMDSAQQHAFRFDEGISIMVYCKDQDEIDRYWAALSAVPEAEQCGWLKDKFGVSWQIVPIQMDEMMNNGDEQAKRRITKAFLKMKKFDLAELDRAFRGE